MNISVPHLVRCLVAGTTTVLVLAALVILVNGILQAAGNHGNATRLMEQRRADFEKQTGVRSVHCYGQECSGLLGTMPVTYRCDERWCDWVRE
jgi:hypothetical protein